MKKKTKRKLTKAKRKLETLEQENEALFERIEGMKIEREIKDEIQKRSISFGKENHEPTMWATIIQEATGRFATQAILRQCKDKDASWSKMRHSAVQCTAILLRIVDWIDGERIKSSEQDRHPTPA
jgi:hypothetical protein